MSRHARTERAALADLLLALGPDAPTINEGWAARDLAAHLVVRERRPDAAAGALLPPLRGHHARVQRSVAEQPFPELIAQLRRPPWWSPVSNPLADETANTIEFVVHHEDLRRAQPDWQPRDLPADLNAALWARLPLLARLTLRGFGARVRLRAPGYGETAVGSGDETVRVIGAPAELLLFFFGRQRVARVQVDGDEALVARLQSVSPGI